MIHAIFEGIGIGFGLVLGVALVAMLMFLTQDMGIWRPSPKREGQP